MYVSQFKTEILERIKTAVKIQRRINNIEKWFRIDPMKNENKF